MKKCGFMAIILGGLFSMLSCVSKKMPEGDSKHRLKGLSLIELGKISLDDKKTGEANRTFPQYKRKVTLPSCQKSYDLLNSNRISEQRTPPRPLSLYRQLRPSLCRRCFLLILGFACKNADQHRCHNDSPKQKKGHSVICKCIQNLIHFSLLCKD